MKSAYKIQIAAAAIICALSVSAVAADSKEEEKQNSIRQMSQDTLNRLYAANPHTRSVVAKAAGYAVFSDLGVKILFAGSGNGQGIAVNNKTKAETFMKMLQLQAGLGMGIKKFRVIFIFDTQRALNSFVDSGWQFGGDATVAAKDKSKGAAMAGATSVSEGVWMYELTDEGIAAEISAGGTKYYKDNSLN
jgi:lipid-binding SYLF domain-containing protein